MNIYKKIKTLYFLKKYNIKNYELIEDDEYGYIVNVNESVNLTCKKLKKLPFQFNEINGSFWCSNNNLESLEGCPKIVKGNFFCDNNKLESLKFCPDIIEGWFNCSKNKLKGFEGLKYLPKEIKDNFILLNENKELKKFVEINDFKELKEKVEKIFEIHEEKENLLNIIKKEELNKIKVTNKINIKKI